jgi:hypothetical protein
MGAIHSYLNLQSKYDSKTRQCQHCDKPINPEVDMMRLWCQTCDTIWCNDCWKYNIDSIAKFRFEECGQCNHDNQTYIKAKLFDKITVSSETNILLDTFKDTLFQDELFNEYKAEQDIENYNMSMFD